MGVGNKQNTMHNFIIGVYADMIDHLAEPTNPSLVETYLYKAVMFIRAGRTVREAVTSPVRWYTLCI